MAKSILDVKLTPNDITNCPFKSEGNIFSKIMLNEENSINNFEKYNIPPDMVHTIMENRLTQISKSLGKEASSNKNEKHVHFKKDQNRDLL